MTKTSFRCFFCGAAAVEDGGELCPACGQDMRVAILIGVYPAGQLKAGEKWTLFPRDYQIGRDPSSDIILADPRVSRKHLLLRYANGRFKANYHIEEKPVLEEKAEGLNLPIGDGRFRVQYLHEFDYDEYKEESNRIFPIALSTASLAHKLSDVQEIKRLVVDAMLAITEMEKGYFLSLADEGGETHLVVDVGRTVTLGEVELRFAPISVSSIEKVIASKGDIIYMDAGNVPAKFLSESIVNYHLTRIICVPMFNSAGRLFAVIYMDTYKVKNIYTSPVCWKSALRLLGDLVARRLETLAPG